jgi:hypothetical protein
MEIKLKIVAHHDFPFVARALQRLRVQLQRQLPSVRLQRPKYNVTTVEVQMCLGVGESVCSTGILDTPDRRIYFQHPQRQR